MINYETEKKIGDILSLAVNISVNNPADVFVRWSPGELQLVRVTIYANGEKVDGEGVEPDREFRVYLDSDEINPDRVLDQIYRELQSLGGYLEAANDGD